MPGQAAGGAARRLAFMGTPDFAATALQALIAAGHDVAAVYCQPPRPSGRGQSVQPSAVQRLAEAQGLPVRYPVSLKPAEIQAEFAALALDIAVVAAYGLILPRPILDAPRWGCVNIHASLLPRWRGAAPIQRAIEAGDPETGVTIMRMEAGLDTGPMLRAVALPISATTNTGDLHDALADLGARLIVETLAGDPDRWQAVPQDAAGVTYAAKLDKAEMAVDWAMPAPLLERKIRAFAPRPAVHALIAGERVKLLAALPATGDGLPGRLLDDQLTVACGSGALRLTLLQRPGRGPVTAEAFLNGCRLRAGQAIADPPLPG